MRSTFRNILAAVLLLPSLLIQGAPLNQPMHNPTIDAQGHELHAPGPVVLPASSKEVVTTSSNPSSGSPPAAPQTNAAPPTTLSGRPNWNPLWGLGPVIPAASTNKPPTSDTTVTGSTVSGESNTTPN